MRVINIIKDLKPIRMGVWTAAINTAPALLQKFNIESEIWFPDDSFNNPSSQAAVPIAGSEKPPPEVQFGDGFLTQMVTC